MAEEKILVVDDEENIRELCQRVLNNGGYKTDVASSSKEALDKLNITKFDLLITDIKMAEMNGIELMELVKKQNADIEVVIITAYPSLDSALSALRSGAYDYILKPFTVQELLNITKRCLEKQKLLRENLGLKKINALYEVSKAIATEYDWEKLLEHILNLTLETTKADGGSLMLMDKNNRGLIIKASAGLKEEVIKLVHTKLGERIAGYVAKEGKPLLLVGEFENDPRFSDLQRRKEIKCALSVPLKIKDEIIGVLNLNNFYSPIAFTQSDLELLTVFAEQIALIIEDARLHQKLKTSFEKLQQAHEELKQMQNQLIQSEKLAAIGQLAAGVAHEVNNPLAIISGYAQLMLKIAEPNDDKTKYLKTVEEEIERIAKIVQALLEFARQTEPERKEWDINKVLEDTLIITEHQISRFGNIKVIKEFSPSLPLLLIDKNQIQQVFVNIIINATQAMKEGGELKIITENESSKNQIIINFADTGPGISEEQINKIFDPFFTTKKDGTGLGLAISYGIIEKHQGEIEVESPTIIKDGKKKGTTFKITLPY